MEQYYTLQEVMARLNISRDTIMGLIRKGKIPGTIKLSSVFRIPESGIQRFLEAQTVQPRKPFYVLGLQIVIDRLVAAQRRKRKAARSCGNIVNINEYRKRKERNA